MSRPTPGDHPAPRVRRGGDGSPGPRKTATRSHAAPGRQPASQPGGSVLGRGRVPAPSERLVGTPRGDARVRWQVPAGRPSTLLVLGHGAGGGTDAPDLVAVAAAVVAAGIAVAGVEQPYRVAGRRTPPPAPALDEAWTAVVGAVRADLPGVPLVLCGRSSGARVACRTATALGAAGVIALAFPTHPPGRPDRDRLAELALPVVPVLVVQGERDPFGLPPPAPGRTVVVVAGGDHALRRPAQVQAAAGAVVRWLVDLGLTAGRRTGDH